MYEYQVDIGGVMYGMNDIESASIDRQLFTERSIGNTCSAMLEITVWPLGTIPRMARIVPYCREIGTNEWEQLGIFYISTRSKSEDMLKIVAYDTMLKSNDEWKPAQDLIFPMTMEAAATVIASAMGTTLDKRCVFNPSYMVDYPANGYTMRDVLQFIAVAHVGNWIVTADGELLLVPLYGAMPEETFYLVTEYGAPIQVGEVFIHS